MTSTDLRRPRQLGGFVSPARLSSDALRGQGPSRALQSTALVGVLAGVAIGIGWLIADGDTRIVLAALVAVPALLVAFTPRVAAPLAAALVLVVMNGIPVVNLSGRGPGGIKLQDLAVILLIALLYAYRDRGEAAGTAPYVRAFNVWGAVFVAWWAITVARTVLVEGEPIRYAFLDGRDFLYFGLLVPLALRARFPAQSVRIAVVVLLGGTAVYAAGQTVASLTGYTASVIVHPTHSAVEVGQTRLFSPMNYVVDSCLIFAAALLSEGSVGRRWIVRTLVLLLAASALLGLTRANYFGLTVAALACAIVYVRRHGSVSSLALRAFLLVLVAVAVAVLFTAITGHNASLAGNPITTRVTKGLTDIGQSTGTFGYRKQLDELMLQVLGTSWPIGLGFLHPGHAFLSVLPGGTIRNADTGVFNVLMTMGLIGLLLLYAPLAYALRRLLRVSRQVATAAAQSLPRWVLYAGVGWVAWAVASSATLVVLFSVPGVVVSALALAVLGWAIRDLPATPAPERFGAVAATVDSPNGHRNGRSPKSAEVAQRVRALESSRVARRMPAPARLVAPTSRAAWFGPAAARPAAEAPEAAAGNGTSPHRPVPRAPMRLSVVIVTHNSGQCVRGCIKALRTVLGGCEIVVVDNMSVDDTISAVRTTDARVRVLSKGRNAGYGSACNSGVRAAGNEHVMLMNPDVRLEHADLEMLAAILAEPRLGLLAPSLQTDEDGGAQPQTFAGSTWFRELGTIALGPFRPRALGQPSRVAEIDQATWASGALMMVRRGEFLAVGGFDERFFLYYEDQDLGIRYREAGFPIRGTAAVTGAHRGGQSVAEDGDQRVMPMAWCVLGWLEFVAMRYGARRAALSWWMIAATHGVGGRLVRWAGAVTRIKRLRRKAAQLESVDNLVRQIARAGARDEHPSCPAACRVISSKRAR